MKSIFASILAMSVFYSSSALACSCMIQNGKSAIQGHQVIFDGIAIKTYIKEVEGHHDFGRTTCTTFKVSRVYKGQIGDQIDICYGTEGSMCGINPYTEGTDVIIFTSKGKNNVYSTSLCAPRYQVEEMKKYPDRYAQDFKTIDELENFKSRIDALDLGIQKDATPALYTQKGQLLEEYKDYDRSIPTYRAGIEKAGAIGNSIKQQYYKSLIEDPYAAMGTEQKIDDALILGYGRSLYYSGQFKESLKPLKMIEGIEAQQLYMSALAQTDQKHDLDKKPVLMANQTQNEVNLLGMRIEHSDFSGSSFRKADLTNSKLAGTSFQNAKILELIAPGADFSNSNFSQARIQRGDMSGANLRNANLRDSLITEMSLKGADITGADLSNAKIEADFDGAILKNANLEHARISSLAGAKLENTKLDGIGSMDGGFHGHNSDFSGIDLSKVNLSGSYFPATRFIKTNFSSSNLSNALLRSSDFDGADFSNTKLNGADFRSMSDYDIKMRGTNLSNANLATADISNARLEGAIYNCNTKFPAGFDPVKAHMVAVWDGCAGTRPTIDLSVVEAPDNRGQWSGHVESYDQRRPIGLREVNLSGAKFDNSDFRFLCYSCDFSGATFRNANMHGELRASKFVGADFTGTTFDNVFRFTESDLRGVNFSGAHFRGRPMLFRSQTDETTIWPQDLSQIEPLKPEGPPARFDLSANIIQSWAANDAAIYIYLTPEGQAALLAVNQKNGVDFYINNKLFYSWLWNRPAIKSGNFVLPKNDPKDALIAMLPADKEKQGSRAMRLDPQHTGGFLNSPAYQLRLRQQ